jgi:hypothetical protein
VEGGAGKDIEDDARATLGVSERFRESDHPPALLAAEIDELFKAQADNGGLVAVLAAGWYKAVQAAALHAKGFGHVVSESEHERYHEIP